MTEMPKFITATVMAPKVARPTTKRTFCKLLVCGDNLDFAGQFSLQLAIGWYERQVQQDTFSPLDAKPVRYGRGSPWLLAAKDASRSRDSCDCVVRCFKFYSRPLCFQSFFSNKKG